METVSGDFTLKPSLPRMFLGDLLIFLCAYGLMLVSRGIVDPAWVDPSQARHWMILLAAGTLACLLVGALEGERMTVRLSDGQVEGRAPFSWRPVGFALARLDRQKTLESLKSKQGPLMKHAYLWSVDGERILFRPQAFEPGEVEVFLRVLGM